MMNSSKPSVGATKEAALKFLKRKETIKELGELAKSMIIKEEIKDNLQYYEPSEVVA
jgi:hypothetical protein